MKLLTLSLSLFILISTTATAQKFDLSINAGANVSLLPDLTNKISIVDGFVVPGIISINNAQRPPVVTERTSEVTPGFSYNVEVEAVRKLNNKWAVSFSLIILYSCLYKQRPSKNRGPV